MFVTCVDRVRATSRRNECIGLDSEVHGVAAHYTLVRGRRQTHALRTQLFRRERTDRQTFLRERRKGMRFRSS